MSYGAGLIYGVPPNFEPKQATELHSGLRALAGLTSSLCIPLSPARPHPQSPLTHCALASISQPCTTKKKVPCPPQQRDRSALFLY